MAYLPQGMPEPVITERDEAPFWEGCRVKELRIQKCAECGRFRHPPGPVCAHCRSYRTEWVTPPGTGTVFSYTIAHHAVHPALKQATPYNVALVHLDGAGDVRLVSNVVDAEPGEMRVGMRVSLFWDEMANGGYLPRFKKAAAEDHGGGSP